MNNHKPINLTNITERSSMSDVNLNFRKLQTELGLFSNNLAPSIKEARDWQERADNFLRGDVPVSETKAFEYTEDFTLNYAQKRISSSPSPPENPDEGDLWLDNSTSPPSFLRWNGTDWEKVSTTTFEELKGMVDYGQLPDNTIDSIKIAMEGIKELNLENGAVSTEKLLDDAITDAKIAADAVKNIHIENGAINNSKLDDLAVTAEKIANGSVDLDKISDIAKKAINTQAQEYTDQEVLDTKNGLLSEIADKADIEYIDGKLVDKANVDDVYTIEELDNIMDNKVSITEYETDMSGVVSQLESHTTRFQQNEEIISFKADKSDVTDLGDRIENAEGSISTLAGEVELRATQTFVDGVDERLESAEGALRVLPDEIEAKVDSNGVIAAFNLSPETAKLEAQRIDLVGDVNIVSGETRIADVAIGTAAIKNGAITNAKINSLHADKITAGVLAAERIAIGSLTQFEDGFDPTTKETPSGAQSKANSALSEAKSHAETKASEAQAAAEDVAEAEANLAKAHADSKVSDEKDRAIQEAQNKLDEAKSHADEKSSQAESAAKTYAEAKATSALSEAKEYRDLWAYTNTTYIDGGNIYTNSITANQIASNAITAAKINANAITTAKIAANAVSADAIASNAILTKHISSGAVTANEIKASAVTADAIASGAILTKHISSNQITADKIKAKSISSSKLDVDSLSAISANIGNVTAGTIDGVDITGVNIGGSTFEIIIPEVNPNLYRMTTVKKEGLRLRGGSTRDGNPVTDEYFRDTVYDIEGTKLYGGIYPDHNWSSTYQQNGMTLDAYGDEAGIHEYVGLFVGLTSSNREALVQSKRDLHLKALNNIKMTANNLTIEGLILINSAKINQSGYHSATLKNGWSNFGSGYYNGSYMLDSIGFVSLRGLIKNGSTNVTCFDLPAGYRPGRNLSFPVIDGSNSPGGRVNVYSNGSVQVRVGTDTEYVDLSSISFFAEE